MSTSAHFVIGAYPPSIGGAQIHTQALAEELARRGVTVRVSCHWRETRTDWVLGTTARLPAGRHRDDAGAVTVDTVGLAGGRRLGDAALAPLYYAVRGPLAARFAARLDFDDGDEAVCHVVRMGREHLGLRALNGARAAGRPVLVTPNHHERWSRRPDPVWRKIYREADLLFAMTGKEVELLADVGADPERIVVTGVGPVLSQDADEAEARRALGLPDGEIVTFLGQQYAYKGLDIAIAAFERVADARHDAVLVIAGPTEERTERLVARSRARARIRVVGAIGLEEKTGLLAASRALLLPSAQEAFGGVVVEAAAMGCPYVVSDIPQLREVHDAIGFGAVAARTSDAFADALAAVLDHPPGDRESARARISDRYSWETLAERYLEAYARVAPGSRE